MTPPTLPALRAATDDDAARFARRRRHSPAEALAAAAGFSFLESVRAFAAARRLKDAGRRREAVARSREGLDHAVVARKALRLALGGRS